MPPQVELHPLEDWCDMDMSLNLFLMRCRQDWGDFPLFLSSNHIRCIIRLHRALKFPRCVMHVHVLVYHCARAYTHTHTHTHPPFSLLSPPPPLPSSPPLFPSTLRGNSILSGPHGQQLYSIAKFSLYLAGYHLCQLDCSSNDTFRSSLRALFRRAGLEGKPVAAILTVSIATLGTSLVRTP